MLAALLAIPGIGSAYSIIAGAIGFILRCTPCMIAIAIGVSWIAGDIHGHRKESAAWSAKWAEAETQAEADRQKRDALVKAKIEADASDRLSGVSRRSGELEQKVQKYEAEEAARSVTGNSCLTDRSDDQWLYGLQHRDLKSKISGPVTERLRAIGRRSSAARKPGR